MEITKTQSSSPAFGMLKFHNNKNFKEVVDYAVKNDKVVALDWALNKLLHVQGNHDVVIIHGTNPDTNQIYSSFSLGKRSVHNLVAGMNSPAEATFNAIFTLADSASLKLDKLIGKPFKKYISPAYIFERYTTKW